MTAPAGRSFSAQERIGARIRELRQQRGLRLEDLGQQAGISYQYLSGVENGKENFSISVLDRIATALEVPLSRLIVSAFKDAPKPKLRKPDAP